MRRKQSKKTGTVSSTSSSLILSIILSTHLGSPPMNRTVAVSLQDKIIQNKTREEKMRQYKIRERDENISNETFGKDKKK